jgi:general secretion pathway protein J
MIRPGMTLAETLVGLVVLGLVAVLGLSALGMVGRAGAAVAPDPAALAAVQEFWRHRLAAALPVVATEPRPGRPPSLAFEGSATRLVFVAELPARFATPGPALIELDQAEGALRLRWRPLSAAAAGEGAEGRALLTGIAGLGIRYFGAPRADEVPGWRAEWRDAAVLPQLVELSLAFPEDDPRRWPPLVVAPRLARRLAERQAP